MTPHKQPIVFIRPGHSGINPTTGEYLTMTQQHAKFAKFNNGKKYHENGYFYEGVSNRRIGAEYMKQATAAGLHVIPVHHPYLDFSLQTYCDIANNLAKLLTTPSNPSILLDIHSNAFNGTKRGFTAYYYPGYVSNGQMVRRPSTNGMRAAECFAARCTPYFEEHGSIWHGDPVREGWVYRGNQPAGPFFMLQNTNMAAVTLENGFFDNEHDADLLMDSDFCVGLVTEMVNATWDFFKPML